MSSGGKSLCELARKNKKAPWGDGKVKITLVSGKDLVAKDSNGLSDPYCLIWIGPRGDFKSPFKAWRSSVQRKTLAPEWNESHTFTIKDICDPSAIDFMYGEPTLHIQVWDQDLIGKNDYMGDGEYDLSGGYLQTNVRLTAAGSHSAETVSGSIIIKIDTSGDVSPDFCESGGF